MGGSSSRPEQEESRGKDDRRDSNAMQTSTPIKANQDRTNEGGDWQSPAPRGHSGAPPSAGYGSSQAYHNRLVAFYTKYNPRKVSDTDLILAEWRGNEESLFAELVKRYGPEPRNDVLINGIGSQQASPTDNGLHSSRPSPNNRTNGRPDQNVSAMNQSTASSMSPSRSVANDALMWRNRFARFFMAHDASKLSQIENLLAQCVGREQTVMDALTELYGPEPSNSKEMEWKVRFSRFFQKYDPPKVPQIDRLIAFSTGKENGVMRELVKLYGPEPEEFEFSDLDAKIAASAQSTAPTIKAVTQPTNGASIPNPAASSLARATPSPSDPSPVPIKAIVVPQDTAKAFRRRLSGLLGVKAPQNLSLLNAPLEECPPDAEDFFAFLKNSFGPEPSEEQIRAYFAKRLEKFYELHEPIKAPGAAAEMATRVGDEEEYMRQLIAEYGRDPAFGVGSHWHTDLELRGSSMQMDQSGIADSLADSSAASTLYQWGSGSRWWNDSKMPHSPITSSSNRRVSDVLLCGSAPSSPYQVDGQSHRRPRRDTHGIKKDGHHHRSVKANPAIHVDDDDFVPNTHVDAFRSDPVSPSQLETEELRRITREQQMLLIEHAAEADEMRRAIFEQSQNYNRVAQPMVSVDRPRSEVVFNPHRPSDFLVSREEFDALVGGARNTSINPLGTGFRASENLSEYQYAAIPRGQQQCTTVPPLAIQASVPLPPPSRVTQHSSFHSIPTTEMQSYRSHVPEPTYHHDHDQQLYHNATHSDHHKMIDRQMGDSGVDIGFASSKIHPDYIPYRQTTHTDGALQTGPWISPMSLRMRESRDRRRVDGQNNSSMNNPHPGVVTSQSHSAHLEYIY